jgi:GH25 family lysozyme M1 (1,4-beta-N-acetylmuramidase)
MIKGIDCSSWQGNVNWPAVKAAGIEFAYIKASDGTSSSYPTATAQFKGATDAGLVAGAYHYGQPSNSAKLNAAAFATQLKALGAINGHLPPCLDLETGSGPLGGWAAEFVAELRRLTGATQVMVYSGASFFQTQITESWMDPDVVVWIAHYGRTPGQPGYLTSRVALHQYSSTGAVPGIAGNVDLNVSLWPLDKLTGKPTPTGGDSTMSLTARQDAMLVALYQYASGSADLVPEGQRWPGWPTWPGGSGENLTATDLHRRANVQLTELAAAVNLLRQDINRIGEAVTSLVQANNPK